MSPLSELCECLGSLYGLLGLVGRCQFARLCGPSLVLPLSGPCPCSPPPATLRRGQPRPSPFGVGLLSVCLSAPKKCASGFLGSLRSAKKYASGSQLHIGSVHAKSGRQLKTGCAESAAGSCRSAARLCVGSVCEVCGEACRRCAGKCSTCVRESCVPCCVREFACRKPRTSVLFEAQKLCRSCAKLFLGGSVSCRPPSFEAQSLRQSARSCFLALVYRAAPR